MGTTWNRHLTTRWPNVETSYWFHIDPTSKVALGQCGLPRWAHKVNVDCQHCAQMGLTYQRYLGIASNQKLTMSLSSCAHNVITTTQ